MTDTSQTRPTSARVFDVLFGDWQVHNRKLLDVSDPTCQEWVEFDMTATVFPVLGGAGHLEQLRMVDPDDGDHFEGLTLRLHAPDSDTWSIWWASTRAPGQLDVPVTGRADESGGVFEAVHVIAGRSTRVRFVWDWSDAESPVWRQFFSLDDGATWRLTWDMHFSRSTHAG